LSDCCVPGYAKVFGERAARRAAARYRRKGLDGDARWLADVVGERMTPAATLLELGGGVGALHVELLRRGAATAVNVEISPEWEREAEALLRAYGLESRVERRIGDAVVMHRVVCCYPDPDRLMDAAAERAHRLLAVSFPRERRLARLVNALSNLWLRLRRVPFRSYVHHESTIEAAAARHAFRPASERRGRIWRAIVFERVASTATTGAPGR
jgi:tRNA A58 N-methylase Trm61